MTERQLYLDCDGVLADFERGSAAILGMPPKAYQARHGPGKFWQQLARAPDFYAERPMMPDAQTCRAESGPPTRKGAGPPATFRGRGSSPAWRSTSATIVNPATC